MLILSPPVLLALFLSSAYAGKEKIEPKLLKKIEASPDGTWNIIVEFERLPLSATIGLSPLEMRTKLMEHAEKTQAEVRKMLTNFESFWISNALSTPDANKSLIFSIAENHSTVILISEDEILPVEEPVRLSEGEPPPQVQPGKLDPRARGVEKIGVLNWWKAGYNGTGVIVGHIDNGADLNHPALRGSWVGEGGWLNSNDNQSKFPQDTRTTSHGTSTLSVILGKGVGVAPGAKYISCSYCSTQECIGILPSHILACADFMLCPNPENNCSLKPHLVSNSWGYGQTYHTKFERMTQNWQQVGIIPIKSAGNKGENGCSSLTVPAHDEEVITVGMVDDKDELDYDSSIGPPIQRYKDDEIISRRIFKPDIVAPGVEIFGAVKNNEWDLKTGTSMATAHVSGAIALLLSHPKGKELNFTEIKKILFINAFRRVTIPGSRACSNFDDSKVPNHKFGYGRIRLPPNPDGNWYEVPPDSGAISTPVNSRFDTYRATSVFFLTAASVYATAAVLREL